MQSIVNAFSFHLTPFIVSSQCLFKDHRTLKSLIEGYKSHLHLVIHTVEGFRSSWVFNSPLSGESKKCGCTANPNAGNSTFQGAVANVQIFFSFFSYCSQCSHCRFFPVLIYEGLVYKFRGCRFCLFLCKVEKERLPTHYSSRSKNEQVLGLKRIRCGGYLLPTFSILQKYI